MEVSTKDLNKLYEAMKKMQLTPQTFEPLAQRGYYNYVIESQGIRLILVARVVI